MILASNCLFAKKLKCRFGVTQIDYLDHIISKEGVAVDPSKIKAVKDWPVPKLVKVVRGFLGLAGYYKTFVRGFGTITAPLNRLLTKEGFLWGSEAEVAFTYLKQALTSPPILKLPDFTQ